MISNAYKMAKRQDIMPVVPEKRWKKPLAQLGLRVPEDMLEEIDAAGDEAGYSRTETVIHLLTWALDEHKKEKPAQRGKG